MFMISKDNKRIHKHKQITIAIGEKDEKIKGADRFSTDCKLLIFFFTSRDSFY